MMSPLMDLSKKNYNFLSKVDKNGKQVKADFRRYTSPLHSKHSLVIKQITDRGLKYFWTASSHTC